MHKTCLVRRLARLGKGLWLGLRPNPASYPWSNLVPSCHFQPISCSLFYLFAPILCWMSIVPFDSKSPLTHNKTKKFINKNIIYNLNFEKQNVYEVSNRTLTLGDSNYYHFIEFLMSSLREIW